MSAIPVRADALTALVDALFVAHGVPPDAARLTADALVAADLEGVASHGVMLVPMYLGRLRAGGVSPTARPTIVEDLGGLVVMSAGNGLGQVSSLDATELAIARARAHGVAAVAVRDAFHFGAAAYWARRFAQAGMIGFAFSNTRPLMPAPGGAERVVGNNPLSIAFPSADGRPLVVDMATSATAMGRIRLADAQGRPIPEGWATDAQGRPTTSAADAIAGMLLPAAGPKGFGLAVAIDLLCGALSGGGLGAGVQPLYGSPGTPYNCAHAFVAIDAARTGGGTGIAARVTAFADAIRHSRHADGVATIHAPGDLERARRAELGERCLLSRELIDGLEREAAQAGLSLRLES